MDEMFNNLLDEEILDVNSVSGGDINKAFKLTTSGYEEFCGRLS